MSEYSMQVPFEIDATEVLLDVTYTYLPGSPAVRHLSNGDPGYPAEAPEIQICQMWVGEKLVPDWFFKALLEGDFVLTFIEDNHFED